MNEAFEVLAISFPPEWAKTALVLALISAVVVAGQFTYLNYRQRHDYLRLWLVAWLFYAVYLTASINLEAPPELPFLAMVRRACVGISALFMYWGCFHLIKAPHTTRELGWATLLVAIWSYVAAYHVQSTNWITVPVFTLLALAAIATGVVYMRHRPHSRGATILGIGFFCWSVHLWASPFLHLSDGFTTLFYLTSFIASLVIATGVVIEYQIILSERHYRDLFDAAGDAMFLVDYESQEILETNPSGQRLAQKAGCRWKGEKLQRLFPGWQVNGEFGLPGLTAQSQGREVRLPQADGRHLVYEASTNLVLSPRGAVLLVIARDITEHTETEERLRDTAQRLVQALADLQRAQDQLIQQERLEALRKMASGVAHDFNNLLARILGFVELLLAVPGDLRDAEKVKKHLQMIRGTAEDGVNVVNHLREFYRHRKETEIYQPVNLNDVVARALTLSQPKWKDQVMAAGSTICVETKLTKMPPIQGSAADLGEVILNLIFNAIDAMPHGGTLRLATHLENNRAVVEVSDTGTGMSEAVRARCLEPFFTTKGTTGTGLGLAIVYGIVQRHRAAIEIQSEEGKGTTVRVLFPVAVHTTETPSATPAPPLRVLVADDEPSFRDFLAQYLRGSGHTITVAANGREALQKFQPGAFDFLITNRAMPELSGDQLIAELRRMVPSLPVLMVTGFADLPAEQTPPPLMPNLIIRKPFTGNDLQQAIAHVFHKSAPAASPERE